ncbi:MAG: arginase family protein [Erysipelotrichaceae bacterium]|nr:arginase family protein [Erysipelotrichaceae bacterium]MDD4642395.1 arginase family protein [Erysipelotrichaceae bacterium]
MIKYIGAPLKEGCTINGADMGMENLAQVFKIEKIIEVIKKEEDENSLLNLNTVTDFLWRLKSVYKDYRNDFVVTLGGDHSIAIASISASYRDNLGVIWVDSHGDFNTDKTTVTKRIHGLPLATLQGLGNERLTAICQNQYIKSENIVLFGVSSLDKEEARLIKQQNIKVIYHKDIVNKGLNICLDEAIDYLNDKAVYLSYDLDSIDPKYCKGVNTPVVVGLDKDEALLVLDTLFTRLDIVGMDLVEYNPLNDDGNTLALIQSFKTIIKKHKG